MTFKFVKKLGRYEKKNHHVCIKILRFIINVTGNGDVALVEKKYGKTSGELDVQRESTSGLEEQALSEPP
jgi:hypothetical protein